MTKNVLLSKHNWCFSLVLTKVSSFFCCSHTVGAPVPIAHPREARLKWEATDYFPPVQGFGNIDRPTNELSGLKAKACKHHLSTIALALSWFCSALHCLLVGLLSFQWKHLVLKQLALLCWNLSLNLRKSAHDKNSVFISMSNTHGLQAVPSSFMVKVQHGQAWTSWMSMSAADHFQLRFPFGKCCQKHS